MIHILEQAVNSYSSSYYLFTDFCPGVSCFTDLHKSQVMTRTLNTVVHLFILRFIYLARLTDS